MEIYIKLFEVLFPVFSIVGIGYYLGKKDPNFDTTFISFDAKPSFLNFLSTYINNISYSNFFSIDIKLPIIKPINLLDFHREKD